MERKEYKVKVDLLKTKITGHWLVEISNIGWAFFKNCLAIFARDLNPTDGSN